MLGTQVLSVNTTIRRLDDITRVSSAAPIFPIGLQGIPVVLEGGKRLVSGSGEGAGRANEPLITVATVVMNGANSLGSTIASVTGQTFRNFEYIVIDGGSTDGTVELLAKSTDQVDYWVSKRDRGIYDAWNTALQLARGQWITFLGADDCYYPDALMAYADLASRMRETPLHYISSRVHLTRGEQIVRTIGGPWAWPAFSRHMTVAHVGSLHHRSLFEEYGFFDDRYRVCGDYEMLLRPRAALRAAFLDKPTARMALGGVSNANVGLALSEQERAKHITGKRAAWLCALERRKAHVTSLCRSLLWY